MTGEVLRRGSNLDTKTKPHAPDGTYSYLKNLMPDSSTLRFFNTSRHSLWARLFFEVECNETGGQCMDILISQRIGRGKISVHHAHITQKDDIAYLRAHVDKDGRYYALPRPPDLRKMLDTIEELLHR